MLYIRTDVNDIIAIGHMMRCFAIAEAIKRKGEKICFLVADENGKALLEQRGFPYIILNSVWNQMEQEIKLVIKLLKRNQVEGLIIDSYYVTEKYLLYLRQYTKVIYIDDRNVNYDSYDILINYAISADNSLYFLKKNTKLLLGCQYAPLRREFIDIPKKVIKPIVNDILVLTGGTDTYHFAFNFINMVRKKKEIITLKVRFHIICGCYNSDIEKLKKIKNEYQECFLYQHVDHLSEIMQRMDLAVSAGGSTLYELCACGIPTCTYLLADNQLNNVRQFNEMGIMDYTGDIRKPEYDFERLFDKIIELSKDKARRQQISAKMQNMIDGKGADRIAEFLLKNLKR